MTEIIETSTDGRLRVCLVPDSDADSPRIGCDRLTHVITVLDRHYADVDMDGGPLADGWRQIKDRDKAVGIFTRWAQIAHGAEVIEDRAHDGPRTIWYLMPEGIAEVNDPEDHIRSEIAEYRAWARDEVYGYIIERAVKWKPLPDEYEDVTIGERTTWEEVTDRSCWGLITYEGAEREAKDQFTAYLKSLH
ncbi:hypothetical protein ACPXCO_23035 [Streptomyces cyaneofuscatus]|uniref:hypothetical protein n=1 Tax=Streptomyces cyaneofuscatus TaxID=66883 RepID=UPI003CE9EE37